MSGSPDTEDPESLHTPIARTDMDISLPIIEVGGASGDQCHDSHEDFPRHIAQGTDSSNLIGHSQSWTGTCWSMENLREDIAKETMAKRLETRSHTEWDLESTSYHGNSNSYPGPHPTFSVTTSPTACPFSGMQNGITSESDSDNLQMPGVRETSGVSRFRSNSIAVQALGLPRGEMFEDEEAMLPRCESAAATLESLQGQYQRLWSSTEWKGSQPRVGVARERSRSRGEVIPSLGEHPEPSDETENGM